MQRGLGMGWRLSRGGGRLVGQWVHLTIRRLGRPRALAPPIDLASVLAMEVPLAIGSVVLGPQQCPRRRGWCHARAPGRLYSWGIWLIMARMSSGRLNFGQNE